MDDACNNYLCHTNEWHWGKTVDIIHKQGIGTICVKMEDDYPVTAYICDLSVFVLNRRQGIGTKLIKNALAVARKYGKAFAELNVDKSKDWLVAWYSSLGFQITYIGKDEYTMTKTL